MKKVDDGVAIKCPDCKSFETVKIYQDGYNYQYRCNNCLKISLIDMTFSEVNVNGTDGEVVFVDSPQEANNWRDEGKMVMEDQVYDKSWVETAFTGEKINSSVVFIDIPVPTKAP